MEHDNLPSERTLPATLVLTPEGLAVIRTQNEVATDEEKAFITEWFQVLCAQMEVRYLLPSLTKAASSGAKDNSLSGIVSDAVENRTHTILDVLSGGKPN